MNRLIRFRKPAGSTADTIAILKEDYARMERRADKLKVERDKLVEALRPFATSLWADRAQEELPSGIGRCSREALSLLRDLGAVK